MRGKPRIPRRQGEHRRNIPAYAGKTPWRGVGDPPNQEHPRVCGENRCGSMQLLPLGGTSPRMRGKRESPERNGHQCGNIPAYAGKTGLPPSDPRVHAEHPRVCGENVHWFHGCRLSDGTSPRMRGKPRCPCRYPARYRNIPAYAGKTRYHHHPDRSLAEHPRVCGENQMGTKPTPAVQGTSPRMRGKRIRLRS